VGKDVAFITGASGFVGSAVARELLREGFVLRALVRPNSPRKNLTGLQVKVIEGDMRDKDAVISAAQGSRYVVHLAADYRLWSPHEQDIIRANVEGTRVVMEAARAVGAERIVYTSSVATLKLREDGAPADETAPLTETAAYGAYKRSKRASGGHCQPLNSRRPARPSPDAHRSDDHRSCVGPHACLCRYRPQYGACR